MVQYSNLDRVMEARDHSKNEVNRENLFNFFIRGVSFVIIFFIFASCKNEKELFLHEPPPTIVIMQVENGVKISWSKVHGADSYAIERSDIEFNPDIFHLIYVKFIFGNGTTFYIDENPIEGDNYYRVRAFKEYYYNGYSNVVLFSYTALSGGTKTD